jgi:short-subunit dehydrogenase
MTFIIVGASAGLGRAIAEKFASEKNDLILISSDMRDLMPLKSDFEIRFKIKIKPIEISFKEFPIDYSEIVNALSYLSPLEGILFPIGYSIEDDFPGLEYEKTSQIFKTNLVSVCTFVNNFLSLLKTEKAVIIGFGSVAAIRGRSRNAVYSASKRGLESFFESLRHYTQNSNIIIQYYVLGYLDTTLAFNDYKTVFFKRADVKKIADVVYSNRFKDFGKTYYPKSWKIVKLILPLVPWNIFKKMNF